MMKILALLDRQNGMSHEQFSSYWQYKFSPQALAVCPDILRYVQNDAVDQTSGEHQYDGIAEEYYPDLRAFEKASAIFQSESGKALRQSLETFTKPGEMIVFRVKEINITKFTRECAARRRNMIKAITFFKRRPDVSLEHFCKYWHERHAPLVLRVQPEIRKYIQNHSLDSAQPFDGIAETWYEDMDAFRRVFDRYETKEGKEAKKSMETFADTSKTMNILTRERVIKA